MELFSTIMIANSGIIAHSWAPILMMLGYSQYTYLQKELQILIP